MLKIEHELIPENPMTQISEQALQAAVREYRDPYLNKDLYELGAVKSLNADDNGNVTHFWLWALKGAP